MMTVEEALKRLADLNNREMIKGPTRVFQEIAELIQHLDSQIKDKKDKHEPKDKDKK